MWNLKLNLGGLLGAVLFGGVAAILCMLNSVETTLLARVSVLALVVGAFLGTVLWNLAFPPPPPVDEAAEYERRRYGGRRRYRNRVRRRDDEEDDRNPPPRARRADDRE